MRQAILKSPRKIEFQEIEPSVPGQGQVRIRIQRIGVCGSDIHAFHGKHPFVVYPFVQGHEFAGVVESVGSNVESVNAGDKVTAAPQEVCGKCPPCRRGQYNACENLKVRGFQAPGCAQDLFVTEADKIIKLPDDFTPEQGVFIEPVAVAMHAILRAGDLTDKNIVVSGAGTIGNLTAQACKARGAAKVLVSDISDYRLEIARRVGLEKRCNVQKENFSGVVENEFGGDGFEIGMEAAGVEKSLEALVANIGKGGTILNIGVHEEKPRVDMSVVCEHELTLKGSMMYRREDWTEAVEQIARGKIKTEPLISRNFPFHQYQQAYEFIEQEGDQAMKVMIDFEI